MTDIAPSDRGSEEATFTALSTDFNLDKKVLNLLFLWISMLHFGNVFKDSVLYFYSFVNQSWIVLINFLLSPDKVNIVDLKDVVSFCNFVFPHYFIKQ